VTSAGPVVLASGLKATRDQIVTHDVRTFRWGCFVKGKCSRPSRRIPVCNGADTRAAYVAVMQRQLLTSCALVGALAGCPLSGCAQAGGDEAVLENGSLKLPSAIKPSDFRQRLDKRAIRALQTWLDDAAFEVKFASMLTAPLELLGGASSAYHADLAGLSAKKLPGDEVVCHGDPKIDNFGWTLVDGAGVFSDNDFDDAGFCPVAADALRYLLATDLAFDDPDLDAAALEAYVDTVADKGAATDVDPASEPAWDDVRSRGLAKDSHGDLITLGGEVQAATADEKAAVRALVAADARFPRTVLDVARNVRTTGGSAGFRRFWLLTQDARGTRTIIELKELGAPATELGRHSDTLDGADRFDVLKAFWWGAAAEADHFGVELLGSRWVARDRLTRTNPKPDKLSTRQLTNLVMAEASVMALRHRKAWNKVKKDDLRSWLRDSSATLVARWRATYAAAGGQ